MSEPRSVEDLLSRWDCERAKGRDVTVQELCVDHPELMVPLQRRIETIQRLERGRQCATRHSTLDANAAPAEIPVVGISSPPPEASSTAT